MIALRLFLAFVLALAPAFPARKGTASTDRLTTANTITHPTTASYCWWQRKNGTTGTNPRIIDTTNDGTGFRLYITTSTMFIVLQTYWNSAGGTWTSNNAISTSNVWEHFCITYDSGSTTNDPAMYKNGSSWASTENIGPAGTYTPGTNAFVFLNRPDGARPNDMEIADFCLFDRIVSSSDIDGMGAKKYSCSCFNPKMYVSFVQSDGNELDKYSLGGVVSETGTITKTDQPPVTLCQ